MSRYKGNILAQGPELLCDGMDQGIEIPARKVGATDGALKQHVSHDRKPTGGMEKNNVARGMSRAVANLERLLAECHCIPPKQPAIRLESLEPRKSKALSLSR